MKRLRRWLYWRWEAWAWRRWAKGKRERCPMCTRMTTAEWFAMCDCFNPAFEDDPDASWAPWARPGEGPDEGLTSVTGPHVYDLPWDEGGAGDPVEDMRRAVEDIRNAPIRPEYIAAMCGSLSPEEGWLCALWPTEAAHMAGHFARDPDRDAIAAVWATTGDEWWARRP